MDPVKKSTAAIRNQTRRNGRDPESDDQQQDRKDGEAEQLHVRRVGRPKLTG